MVSLIQLEYVVAVDTYRHFVTAAEKCFVTQPTLSMQIRKLEDFLDVVIFDRSKQPVIPTDIGEKFIEQARNILRESGKLTNLVDQFKASVSGVLRIGIIPSLAPYLLPLFIGKLARKYPELDIMVQELITDDLVAELNLDRVDVGIVVTPLNDSGILEEPLFYEEIKIYTNPQHSLMEKRQIEVIEINTPDIWLLSQGHCFRHQIINLCSLQAEGLQKLPFKYESESIETIKKIVDMEGGLTLIPELSLDDLPREKMKQVKSFKDIVPLREVSLVYVHNYAKRRLLDVLADEIKVSVPEGMLDEARGTVVDWR